MRFRTSNLLTWQILSQTNSVQKVLFSWFPPLDMMLVTKLICLPSNSTKSILQSLLVVLKPSVSLILLLEMQPSQAIGSYWKTCTWLLCGSSNLRRIFITWAWTRASDCSWPWKTTRRCLQHCCVPLTSSSLNHLVESRQPWFAHSRHQSLQKEVTESQSKEKDFISLSRGSTLLSRRGLDTRLLAGLKFTNSMRVIKDALLTVLMSGLIAWARVDKMLTQTRSLGMPCAH